MKRSLGMLVAFTILGTTAFANWPQFQGPNRDGNSNETVKLAESWPEAGPPIAWKMEDKLGTGYGGAIVDDGKVYLLDRVNDQQDVLRCMDLKTGAQEWTFEYDAPLEAKENKKLGQYKGAYNGSRNLPVSQGKFIWTLGPFGDVNCIDKESHQSVWSTNIIKEYDAALGNWGICQSPVLYKDTLIVAPLSKKAGIVALDKNTGKEVWKSARIGDIAWTSPFISTIDGVDQVVMFIDRGSPKLIGLDASNGEVLWKYTGYKVPNPIASQTDCGQGRFFITGGYKSGCALVQVKKEQGQWAVSEIFQNKDLGAQAVKPVFYKDHIYANSNDLFGGKEGSGLMCMDLTGKVKWKTANTDGEENGSVLIADGKIYSFQSQTGILRMASATPEGYKELGKMELMKGREFWAPMAISEGKLLVRCRRNLYCLDVSAK